jgi:hypothetical protein
MVSLGQALVCKSLLDGMPIYRCYRGARDRYLNYMWFVLNKNHKYLEQIQPVISRFVKLRWKECHFRDVFRRM